MPGLGSVVSGVLQAAPQVVSMINSISQYKKGMRMFNDTPQPVYTIPQQILSNQSIATTMAMNGMPATQFQQGLNQIGRSQTTGLKSIGSLGGAVGDVGAIVGAGDEAANNLAVASANQRLGNVRTLMDTNQTLAEYEDKAFNLNSMQKYLMKMGMASSLISGGKSGLMTSLNNLGKTLLSSDGGSGTVGGDMGNGIGNLFSGAGGAAAGASGATAAGAAMSAGGSIAMLAAL